MTYTPIVYESLDTFIAENPVLNHSSRVYGYGAGAVRESGSISTPLVIIPSTGLTQSIAFPSFGTAAYDITLTTNCAISVTGVHTGQFQSIYLIIRSGTGGFTCTLPSSIKWPGGVVPVIDTTAGEIAVFTLSTPDGGTTILGSY